MKRAGEAGSQPRAEGRKPRTASARLRGVPASRRRRALEPHRRRRQGVEVRWGERTARPCSASLFPSAGHWWAANAETLGHCGLGQAKVSWIQCADPSTLSESEMQATRLLTGAFAAAFEQFQELYVRWVAVSNKIGLTLPDSTLTLSVQRVGRLDLVARALEDERFDSSQPINDFPTHLLRDECQGMISELWVGSVYEIVRLLEERKLVSLSEEFKRLHDDLRMVRIPVEKLEIARGSKLPPTQEFARIPAREGDEPHAYRHKDPQRSHILPMRLSARGSTSWLVLDAETMQEKWVERRALSDEVLALWS